MNDLRSILTEIYTRRGQLTPHAVVDEARDENHPLHPRFEWDDKIASEKYREVQAAQIIRSVKIKYAESSDGPEKDVRAFHVERGSRDDELGIASTYRPTEELLANDVSRKILLREMERDWKLFKARYSHLCEFAALIAGEVSE